MDKNVHIKMTTKVAEEKFKNFTILEQRHLSQNTKAINKSMTGLDHLKTKFFCITKVARENQITTKKNLYHVF